MKSIKEISKKLNELETSLNEAITDKMKLENGSDNDLINQIDFVNFEIEIISQKVELLKWVLSKN